MTTIYTIYTIGHSNHGLERFLELLEQHGITCVLDVRSCPYSRYVRHLNQPALKAALERRGVLYVYAGQRLGGLSPHAEHYVNRRLDYVLWANSPDFQTGLAEAAKIAKTCRAALMCSEEDPLRCHRGLVIGRHFYKQDWVVLHIRADGRTEDQKKLETRLREDDGAAQQRLLPATMDELYETQGRKIAPKQPLGSQAVPYEGDAL